MVLTNVILPIFFIIFLGFLLRKYGKVDLKTFSRAQLYILSPALGFMSLAKPEADTNLILQVLVFMIALQAVLLGISLGVSALWRRDRAERQAIAMTSTLANTGFYGIPVCLLAFGEWGLVYATIYMVASSILQSTVGIFLASAGRQSSWKAFVSIFKVPLIWSIVAARLLVYLHALPSAPFMKMIDMLGEASIPTGLMLLGMQLESIVLESAAWRATLAGATHGDFRVGDEHNGETTEGVCDTTYSPAVELKRDIEAGLVSALIKILGGFAAAYGLVLLFHFNANMNQVIVVESAMPTAVNAIVFATEFNCRPRLVAVGILASTLVSVLSVSLILQYLG